ncbi:MAG: SufS family cysteine desulfurase [Lachnospiraceae bacterium]|nr:SufS family cysteine desulfurase [Lachnospiraceae bacterium]
MNDNEILKEFPIFDGSFTYLDSAATSQKPECVINAEKEFYEKYNANPLRGLYRLSVEATEKYEDAREAVRGFINAGSTKEIIFTRNASESLNLVAYSYAENFLKAGDEIVVSILEHHSNFLPWKNAAKKTGAKVVFLDCDSEGGISTEALESVMSEKTKIVAVTMVSNVIGRKNDIKAFAGIAHKYGAVIVADGAQSVPHMKVDVRELDVDFLAFSGHKMYGPMGIGVLYGKEALLESMPPFLYGGEMIETVTRDRTTFAELPHKFEAGTVNAAGAYGLHKAIDFINRIGMENIEKRERELTAYAYEKLSAIPHLSILGSKDAMDHHGILTFLIEGVHPHDVSAILSEKNVFVRAGNHCAQPLLKHLGSPSTTRASLAFYNTKDDIDRLASALSSVRPLMGYDD